MKGNEEIQKKEKSIVKELKYKGGYKGSMINNF